MTWAGPGLRSGKPLLNFSASCPENSFSGGQNADSPAGETDCKHIQIYNHVMTHCERKGQRTM